MRAAFYCVLFGFIVGCASHQPLVRRFGSPEETFETWREAAQRLELDTLIACYARGHQENMRKQIASSSLNELKSMQDETRNTEFSVDKVVFEGSRAFLRVERKRGKDREIEVLNMVRESDGWKLLP